MAHITHELTETEVACGVTVEQVADVLPKVLIRGERVIVPENTPPALAGSVVRCALGTPGEYAGHNPLGHAVYRRQGS